MYELIFLLNYFIKKYPVKYFFWKKPNSKQKWLTYVTVNVAFSNRTPSWAHFSRQP